MVCTTMISVGLFLIYLIPIVILIKKHGLKLHAYADDTQLYVSIKTFNQRAVDIGVTAGKLPHRHLYMDVSKEKEIQTTELLVMGTQQMWAKISIPSIIINGVIVPVLDEQVGNLGAVFNPNMNMSAHVSEVIKCANCHIRNI